MRILAIGDFHGKFPKKFEKIIKKKKVDLVVSNGDYPPFHYRKLWFKHCYGKDTELWEVIGKKKYKTMIMEDLRRAGIALKALNKLPVPVYTVLGNIDWPDTGDVIDIPKGIAKAMLTWDRKDTFAKILKKYKKENKEKRVIFVSHNIAYKTKLDKISTKNQKAALKWYYGKKFNKKKKYKRHYGSKMARRIVNQYHPLLHIGGHIHEGRGKQKLGKSWLINPGSAHEGKAAIIELGAGKVKKIKFIR